MSTYRQALQELLTEARNAKPNGGIEPAITPSDFNGAIESLGRRSGSKFLTSPQSHYAAIETACRDIFYDLVGSTPVEDTGFSEVWNLLDIISILSDTEQCEPSLIFWLLEELLDTQTIDGCRIIFDYLDSRRERITAKHFSAKQLIILRACNELLRRLSRAEDTVFCGRVFIFLFQSFPLGDRSSVNLRGEYHVENVTTFEQLSPVVDQQEEEAKQVESDAANVDMTGVEMTPATENKLEVSDSKQTGISSKSIKSDGELYDKEALELGMDTLYPVFWAIQKNFSMPTRLFNEADFCEFKKGLGLTLQKFRSVHEKQQARGTSTAPDDSRRGIKRKCGEGEDELAASFNPKYLTSRDLFDLEISDLAFRRHILVQALILTDFLLSLTPKAKKKLEDKTNKSVLYGYTLSDEDAQWATDMRSNIAAYLQQGPEGKFYYRMVDTVLSRDKNWAHWKAEGCPLIERASMSAENFTEAKKGAQHACANKRLKVTPLGSLDLDFLSDAGSGDNLGKLSSTERYTIPSVDSFKGLIADDEFDIERASTDEEKRQAADGRASKLWRTLRVASKSRLNLFDKIDDGHDIRALFGLKADDHQRVAESGGIDASRDVDKTASEPIMLITSEKENNGEAVESNGVGESTDERPTTESMQLAPSARAIEIAQDSFVK